jgi:hypothetical protein
VPNGNLFVHWYRHWQERRRLRREARGIASITAPKLWEDVRRRLATDRDAELRVYAEVRAAQLAQPQVDELLKADPTLTGVFGSLLVVAATEQAVKQALATAAMSRR